MKTKILLFIFLFTACIASFIQAQNLSGSYNVAGYFFHPSAPRSLNIKKVITKVSANTYQVDILGDLTGWGFQFTVDNTNHLTNWVATGSTYVAPASGFMTTDNPGGFIYPGPEYPGTSPWIQSTYNNTYDPATHTFYMHYGYSASATNQSGYDRQIYEKYVLVPSVKITSISPSGGTSLTEITITGKNMSVVDPSIYYSVTFGGLQADTAYVVSNTKLIAKVNSGSSGNVLVADTNRSSANFPGFVYTPVPPVTNPQWSYVGKAGFSQHKVHFISTAIGANNTPYVAFVDSVDGKAKVMKYNGTKWIAVGTDVSDGKSGFTDILITNKNIPLVAYVDSANGANITVKKLSSGAWMLIGNVGFAPAGGSSTNPFSFALDNKNAPYILSLRPNDSITVFKFNNVQWTTIGKANFAGSGYGQANLAINKISNTPYLVFDDKNESGSNSGYQATVVKFDGKNWVNVGLPGFTTVKYGVYNCDIEIDGAGNPLASLQDDDGFERQSIYIYKNNVWTPIGYPRFSKSRSYYPCLAIDNNDNPFALFDDFSYNRQGTVMKFFPDRVKWDTIGARGFVPLSDFFERHSLIFDTANTPMVAFSDKTQGGKISIMKYNSAPLLADANQESSDNISTKNNNTVINVFPNPAHSGININFTANGARTTLQVINEKGQAVIQKQITSLKGSNNNVYVNVSKLLAGIYIVSLKANNTVTSKQFVKE